MQRLSIALPLVVAQSIIMVGGVALVVPLALGGEFTFMGTPPELVAVTLMGIVNVALIVWLGLQRLAGQTLRTLGWASAPVGRVIGLGLAGFVTGAAVLISMGGAWSEVASVITDYTQGQHLLFVLVGLQASFIEESLFRGYLQPALQAKLGRWGGLIVGAVIFSLYHVPRGPMSFAGKCILGLIYGLLRDRMGGNLWAPALAHFLIWAILGSF